MPLLIIAFFVAAIFFIYMMEDDFFVALIGGLFSTFLFCLINLVVSDMVCSFAEPESSTSTSYNLYEMEENYYAYIYNDDDETMIKYCYKDEELGITTDSKEYTDVKIYDLEKGSEPYLLVKEYEMSDIFEIFFFNMKADTYELYIPEDTTKLLK